MGDTVYNNIIHYANAKGAIKKKDIAEMIGATSQKITNWKTRGVPSAQYKDIADRLGVSVDDLLANRTDAAALSVKEDVPPPYGADQIDIHNAEIIRFEHKNAVPLISMVAAGDWSMAEDPYTVGDAEKWLDCPVKHGENTFAVRVNGESMYPKFEHGEIIFCDPGQQPDNGSYVIAKLTDNNEATFKQLIIEDGQMLLKSINPNWHTQYIPINGNCEIVGKVIARLEEL